MNRQSKTKRSIMLIIVMVSLVALIAGTYARYTSTGTANATAQIAKWHVELNGEDISYTEKDVDVDFIFDSNQYVADNKFAPGRTAHFDIQLDPSGSEVAIDYTINVDSTAIASALETNSTSKFRVSGATYKVGTEGTTQVASVAENSSITVNEGLSDVEAGKVVTLTVTVEWDNDNNLQNASDTKEGIASAALQDGKVITVPVSVVAQQHI